MARGAQFREDLVVVDLPVEAAEAEGPSVPGFTGDRPDLPAHQPDERLGREAEVWHAIVRGTRDYVRRNGFEEVIVGLSGGIDSAVVAAVAADALGGEHVIGLLMPSPYSTEHSLTDAQDLADNLGIRTHRIEIGPAMTAYGDMLADVLAKEGHTTFDDGTVTVTEENIQSRIRGMIVMALSNDTDALVLTTGNKSEYAVGYATLYGDMNGGYGPIKDVPKTLVFDIARWRADQGPSIPANTISKPPVGRAAPRPARRGLAAALRRPRRHHRAATSSTTRASPRSSPRGHDEQVVRDVLRKIDRSEFKRRQAAPGPKVTHRAFGKERRVPDHPPLARLTMRAPATLHRSVDADGLGRLVLARPDVLNAMSTQMLGEIADAITWFDERDVDVVVVSGEGRAFCAGFDRDEMASPTFEPTAAMRLGAAMAATVESAAAVTIAAVHGHCVGGGLVLATACDLRLAADDTRFAIPEVDLGLPLGWGGIPLLVRELGPTRTRELVMTCRPFDATEAHDHGAGHRGGAARAARGPCRPARAHGGGQTAGCRPRDQGPGAPGRPFAGRPRRRHRRRAGGHRRSPRRRGRLTAPRRRNSRSRGRVAPTAPCGPRATVSPPGGSVRFTGPTPHRPRDRWTRPAGRQAGDSRCPFTLLRSRTGTRPVAPCPSRTCRAAKQAGEKFAMLTAYDYLSAQILDQAGIPVILVGDSLGNVMLGYDSTVPVTADEMIHHTRAVVRGAPTALVVGDLPFGTYQAGPDAGAGHRHPLPQGDRRATRSSSRAAAGPSTRRACWSSPASPSWATSA